MRGLSLAAAGLAVAAGSAAALATGPAVGPLVDRFGARPVLAVSLLVTGAAVAALPLVDAPWHAFAALALAGAGNGGFGASQSALVATLTPRHLRPSAFAVQRIAIHAGLGLGAVAGGLVAGTDRPGRFVALFLFDAFTFVGFAGLLTFVPPGRPPAESRLAGYGAVARNRPLLGFLLLNALMVAAAVAPMASLLPVFARNEAGVGEAWIGALVLLEGLLVVSAQLPVVRALEGRNRMSALGVATGLWALALLVAGSTGVVASAAVPVLVAATVLFAAGKCFHGAVQNPLAADLAEPGTLGRSMALLAVSWQVGLGVGAAVGGVALDVAPLALWPLAALACLTAGALAFALDRRLPVVVRRTPRAAEIPV